jgi:hypothetical protein
VEEEATDLGLRTSYSTAVVVVVFFFFALEEPDAPGRGSGSGLEGMYYGHDRDVRSVNRPTSP